MFLVSDIRNDELNGLNEKNDFLFNLKSAILNYNKFVLVSSNPDEYEKNDKYLEFDRKLFELSGIKFSEYIVLDNRNISKINEVLNNCSLVLLSGGDTYIQNMFFNSISLKKYLKDMVIIGLSAGAINMAESVYNSPESEDDLKYDSVLKGLGLTNINVEPHFDIENENRIQMSSILNESYKRTIYGIPDGSYIFGNKVFGVCYRIKDGIIDLINNDDSFKNI